jgi:hypothetical protein
MSLDMHQRSDGGATGRKARVIVTGSCDGLAELRETLTGHPDLDVPGWCQDVHEARLGIHQPVEVRGAVMGDGGDASRTGRRREVSRSVSWFHTLCECCEIAETEAPPPGSVRFAGPVTMTG